MCCYKSSDHLGVNVQKDIVVSLEDIRRKSSSDNLFSQIAACFLVTAASGLSVQTQFMALYTRNNYLRASPTKFIPQIGTCLIVLFPKHFKYDVTIGLSG